MANNIAKGALVLTLDAQQLDAGLKKTATKAKEAGKSLADNFKLSAGDLLKEKTGGDLGIIGMAGKAGWIGAAVAGVSLLASELSGLIDPVKQLNEQMEMNQKRLEKWRESILGIMAGLREWTDSMADVAATDAGFAKLDNSLEHMRLKVAAVKDELEKARAARGELDDRFDNMWTYLGRGLEDKRTVLDKTIEQLKGTFDESNKAYNDLIKQRERLKDPTSNPAAMAALRQYTQGLTDATRELNGENAEFLKLEALKRQYGLSAPQTDQAREAIRLKESARVAADMRKQVEQANEWIRDLEEELGVYGAAITKTAEDARLAELLKAGVQGDEITRIQKLIQLKKVMNKTDTYKPLQAIERNTVAEVSFNNRNTYESRRDAAMKQQLDILKQQYKQLVMLNQNLVKLDNDKPEI